MKNNPPKTEDWNSVSVSALTIGNEIETLKLYKSTHNWLMWISNKDEELSNDVFMHILSSLPYYNPLKGKLSTFIYTVAINKVRTIISKSKNKKNSLVIYFDAKKILNISDHQLFKQYILEKSNEESPEVELKKLMDKTNMLQENELFIIDYLYNEHVKTPAQRTRFSKLKKILKNGI